ncbi:MAG: Flp pilus assembly complex ATPase component TadA [Thaumarchaeota archaeon]|nr:Flp pilus assembly complex ATPase component TadA [Nitrososphaerota archaeon]
MEEKLYLPDLSAIQLKSIVHLVEAGLLRGRILLHRGLLVEAERQAAEGDTLALEGLEKLVEACRAKGIEIEYVGREVDGKRLNVLEEAKRRKAALITCDPITAKIAESMGVEVVYELPPPPIMIHELFTDEVMSLHLKEGLPPRVKRGSPKSWRLDEVLDKPLTREEMELILAHLMKEAYRTLGIEAFLEVDKPGVKIFQLRDFRVVATRPPFSDGFELTIVKPIIRKSLSEYNLPLKVLERLEFQAEGILIAGPPGMGKSTFAQALAEHYRSLNKIVKTIESPRDLQLSPDITQYSKSASKHDELHDVLLLSRPDDTIFDEIRGPEDFDLFVDLRLAGIGMIGVIHATTPIDAIQRIANRIDIGMLPSIIDTVIFMDKGEVAEIYSLEMTVKVPAGLKKEDLARPTVIVKDFLTDEPKFELYVFGERSFVVPLKKEKVGMEMSKPAFKISNILHEYIPDFRIEENGNIIRIYIPERYYRTYIRKCQNKLLKIAKRYKVSVEAFPQ